MTGRIVGIYIAEQKAQPMKPVSTAVVTRTGIRGDRYEKYVGTWGKNPYKRHITLIEEELIEEANRMLLNPFSWAETRRNLIVNSFPLNGLVNVRFFIGDVLVEGTELCTPCKHPEKLTGKTGFESAFQNRGGLRARILTPGMIVLGDLVRLA